MNRRQDTIPPGSDRSWIPYFVLVISVLGTVLGTYYVATMADTKDRLRLESAVDRMNATVKGRLDTYIALLRSGAAMFAANNGISREEFHNYVERLDLPNRYPGIQGIGLSLRITPEDRDSIEQWMQASGVDSFMVWPATPRNEYHSIVYLEPFDRRNREAIGFDMFSEPVRHAAMEHARDSGTASITGKVTLVQEIDRHKQTGFLIYVPVYRGRTIPENVSERRSKLLGFIYSPFRAGDLLNGIFEDERHASLNFRIYDSVLVDTASLLYASTLDTAIGQQDPLFADTTRMTVAGRPWRVIYTPSSAFERASSRGLVKYIAAFGTLVSLVLFGLTLSQSRARANAEQNAQELRASEERLRESEGRLRRLVESDILGIIIADMAGNVIEANDAFLEIIGYGRDDLRAGRINWADLTPPEYWQEDEEAIRRMRRTGSHPPVEKEFIRSDGRYVPVLVGTAYLGGPDDLGVGFLLDLSEQKKIEGALRHSETRFRTMIEQSPLSIQLFSLDGRCLLSNSAWEELWEAPREALQTYNILQDRQLEEQGVMPYIQRGFAGEALAIPPFRYDPGIGANPGRPRWVRAFIYPLRNDYEEITEIALKVEDVTDRIRAEEELTQAKEVAEAANRAKDQFLAVLSHELRTPLTPVLTAIYLLEETPATTPDQHELLGLIRRNVELEARLIDDLLDLTRIVNGKLRLNVETVDAHLLIRNALEIVTTESASKHLDVVLELDAQRKMVRADSARLQQVFWNLLKNAVKFTPEGGRVLVRTFNVGSMLHVEVSDTGIGIAPDVLSRVFNAFEQGEQKITKQFGGMGLGLAISKMLMDLHAGNLNVASEGEGKGATFTVELATVAVGEIAAPKVVQEEEYPVNGQARILLVEDHHDTGMIMKRLLERQGYSVTATSSVGAALQAAADADFDLLISDIGLPDGTGVELIEQLGTRRPPVAIALSGYGMEDDIRRSINAGFSEHLTKPVNFKRLHEVIRELLVADNPDTHTDEPTRTS